MEINHFHQFAFIFDVLTCILNVWACFFIILLCCVVVYIWPPYSQSGQTPKNQQNHEQIEILLHKWAAGPICPDRYGPYLSFSSGTSQEMSLYKPGKSSQSWRGSAAPTLGGF